MPSFAPAPVDSNDQRLVLSFPAAFAKYYRHEPWTAATIASSYVGRVRIRAISFADNLSQNCVEYEHVEFEKLAAARRCHYRQYHQFMERIRYIYFRQIGNHRYVDAEHQYKTQRESYLNGFRVDSGWPNIQKIGMQIRIGVQTPNNICPTPSAVKKKYPMAPNIAK